MQLQPNIKRFEEVKSGLTTAIVDGKFHSGDRLPSVRNLAAYFEVSLATIQRAVQELKDEEWLVSEPSRGISVADPLPPVAHLMRVKRRSRATTPPRPPGNGEAPSGPSNGTLTCLVYDELLLPLFQWAATEYADALAPYAIRFDLQPLPGHDDVETMRNLDADLVLLPSYAAGRAMRLGTITPAAGMVNGLLDRLAGIAPGALQMVSHGGEIWGVPLMASGAVLTARDAHCRQFGIDPNGLASVDALLAALEKAPAEAEARDNAIQLFNITFPLTLCFMAGHGFPALRDVAATLRAAPVHSLLERLRALAAHPAMTVKRSDEWDRVDLDALALRHQPTTVFCREPANREGSRVLPIPAPQDGGAVLVTHCLCVSAKSVHPYEAWEWAARLAQVPFQEQIAALAYEIPANHSPSVANAFAKSVGPENAGALLGLLQHPALIYGIGPEDIMGYMWEVLGNEAHRFITGMNGYDRMLERIETKTARYLFREAGEIAAHPPAATAAAATTTREPAYA